MRQLASLSLVLLAVLAAPGWATADPISGTETGSFDQSKSLAKVLDEAIIRDKNHSVNVKDRAMSFKNGSWSPVAADGFASPTDVAPDKVRRGATQAVGFRSAEYANTGWKHTMRWSKAPFAREARPGVNEVVANLPPGTEISVSLDREKLDGTKWALHLMTATSQASTSGAGSSASLLAPATSNLPILRVTRQDPSIPEGQAHLRQIRTSSTEPNSFNKHYSRTTSRMNAKVRMTPVRAR